MEKTTSGIALPAGWSVQKVSKLARETGFSHYMANVHAVELARFAALAFAQGMEEAAKICEGEEVDYAPTGSREDRAYNLAVEHCADAIRRAAKGPSE